MRNKIICVYLRCGLRTRIRIAVSDLNTTYVNLLWYLIVSVKYDATKPKTRKQ